jgi:hypothetical protein
MLAQYSVVERDSSKKSKGDKLLKQKRNQSFAFDKKELNASVQ